MDKEKARKLVVQYANKVIQNMKVNKIIFYGSYVRGDYRKNSDIDVAIVVDKENLTNNIISVMTELNKLTRNISDDIEPILLIEDEDKSGFLENISQYGEIIYSS